MRMQIAIRLFAMYRRAGWALLPAAAKAWRSSSW